MSYSEFSQGRRNVLTLPLLLNVAIDYIKVACLTLYLFVIDTHSCNTISCSDLEQVD